MALDLDRRMRALEAIADSGETQTLVVRFVVSGDVLKPLEELSAAGRNWCRLAGESDSNFARRVSAMVPVKANCTRLLVGGGSQRDAVADAGDGDHSSSLLP